METKRVSFEVAKAIKEAGYPQDFPETVGLSLEEKNSEDATCYFYKDYLYSISLLKLANVKYLACPTYLEVWLWLCREKKIYIRLDMATDTCLWYYAITIKYEIVAVGCKFADPEEAIIEAIEYLVDNDLIK